MKQFVSFNLWQPASEDWAYMSSAYDQTTRLRWTDTHTWGILRDNSYPAVVDIPVSAINAAPPRWPNILAGPVTLDCANGLVSVGAGSNSSTDPKIAGLVAYDLYGQRIGILDDAPFDFSNASPYGKKSSGNLNIALNLAGTSGDCFTNPSIPGTYYLWAEYLEINDPTPIVGEDGSVHYPLVDDGYRIRVTDTPAAPSGDGVSIFLAKVTWIGGSGTLTATNSNVSDSNNNAVETMPDVAGDPHRVWAGKRPQHVEIVVDEANKTPAYGLAEGPIILSLHDHINAMGQGNPTHNNPHALTLADIPGAGEEPVATNNQNTTMAKGLVDLNAPQNSPARLGDAGQPLIELVGLVPFASLDPLAAANGITSTPKTRWVRIKDLDESSKIKAAYLEGLRLIRIFPNVRDTITPGGSDPSVDPLDANTGDGWVGFNAAEDTPGTYRIFGKHSVSPPDEISSGQSVLVVNKVLMPGWPSVIPTLPDDQFELGRVYWDGVELYRNTTKPTTSDPVANQPDDLRSLGLVGPQQLSTELKNNPNTGGLAAQVFENQVANSAYAFGLTNVNQVDLGAGKILTSPSVALAGGDLLTGGPAAMTGRRWDMNTGSFLDPSWVFTLLKNVKPGRMYGLSFWAKATNAFNARFRVGLTDDNVANPSSIITLDGSTAVDPLDLTLRNDNLWHRYSIILQTMPSVNADPADLKYLCFQFEPGPGVVATAGQLSLTNVQLTEGEWIPGYMGSKYVPSGGIIMWDASTTCPPGFQEVVGARQKFIVGVDAAAAVVPLATPGGPAFNPGGSLGSTDGESNPHIHNIGNGHTSNANSAPGPDFSSPVYSPGTLGQQHYHDIPVDTGNNSADHTHALPSSVMPYYGLKLCRAI
jgi:hypothetical protein